MISFAQNAIVSRSFPATVSQGQTSVNVSFNYTATAAGTFVIQLYLSPDGVTLGGPVNGTYTSGNNIVATATPKTIGVAVSLPPDLYLATDIAPVTYVWLLKMTVNGVDYQGSNPTYIPLSVTAPLSVAQNTISTSEMFVNTVQKALVITGETVSETARIYDLTGKVVTTLKNLKSASNFDLSGLDNGIYILVTDDKRNFKFAL
jgi:hypothetical protein